MCMLFIKPETLALPRAYFDSLQSSNADGVSFYNFHNKELFKTLDYEEAFQYLQDNAEHKLVVHFRFGTSGKNTIDQLHGWDILDGRYHFFHNGVLSTIKGCKDKSDTQRFVDVINSGKVFKNVDDIIKYLERFENGSRFIILDKETQEIIVPECEEWADVININGCPVQFSNTYAIGYEMQFDDAHLYKWTPKRSYGATNPQYTSAYSSNVGNVGTIEQSDFIADAFYTDSNEMELHPDEAYEIEHLITHCSYKDLLDFVLTNPDSIAKYLKEYA